jgi:hypothetical protein
MSRRFFRLVDDVSFPHRWHLGVPVDSHGLKVDSERFSDGRPLQVKERLKVPVEEAGRPLDFSEAGLGTPVLHVKVASVFAELAPDDVQLIPVDVEGQPDQYLILVATRLLRCIDEKASRVRLWTHEDGEPDLVGQYRDVRDLHIIRDQVGKAKVFRPEGWEVALIVSEELKGALERMGATGARFEEV